MIEEEIHLILRQWSLFLIRRTEQEGKGKKEENISSLSGYCTTFFFSASGYFWDPAFFSVSLDVCYSYFDFLPSIIAAVRTAWDVESCVCEFVSALRLKETTISFFYLYLFRSFIILVRVILLESERKISRRREEGDSTSWSFHPLNKWVTERNGKEFSRVNGNDEYRVDLQTENSLRFSLSASIQFVSLRIKAIMTRKIYISPSDVGISRGSFRVWG